MECAITMIITVLLRNQINGVVHLENMFENCLTGVVWFQNSDSDVLDDR